MIVKEKLDGFGLDELISADKVIVDKEPKKGLKEELNHRRADLTLEAPSLKARFRMYIRQNASYPENFSIGLDYLGSQGEVKLMRFNGSHKREKDSIDNHHCYFHIHKEITEEESPNNINDTETTSEYSDLLSAIDFAFRRLGVQNTSQFFPENEQMLLDLE